MKPNNTAKPLPKPRRKRFILFGVLGLAGVLILALGFLPLLVSTSPVRKLVMARINAAMEGQAEVGQWSWGWISGVHIKDLHLKDALGLARLTVKGIQAKPVLMSLLSGRLALQQTIIDRPTVTLASAKRETDRASGPSGQKAQGREPGSQTGKLVDGFFDRIRGEIIPIGPIPGCGLYLGKKVKFVTAHADRKLLCQGLKDIIGSL